MRPAAELFPLLEGAELVRACREASVEPRFETWDGKGSPFEVVVSMNLRRRHVNESQRAMLAAQISEKAADEGFANWQKTEGTEKTALLMNVSPRSVHRAARILRSGDPELIQSVQSPRARSAP